MQARSPEGHPRDGGIKGANVFWSSLFHWLDMRAPVGVQVLSGELEKGRGVRPNLRQPAPEDHGSLRPRERPDDLRNVLQVAAAAPEGGARDVDPASIAVGTRLAQLGAFASEEIARDEWTRLGSRFEEYLAGKDRVIQKATSGGRTFYRLRAMGFDDLADARRFCSALVAEKAECIPVVTR